MHSQVLYHEGGDASGLQVLCDGDDGGEGGGGGEDGGGGGEGGGGEGASKSLTSTPTFATPLTVTPRLEESVPSAALGWMVLMAASAAVTFGIMIWATTLMVAS